MSVTEIQSKRGGYRPRGINCEGVQQAEILSLTGITYQQLDYWTRTGRLKAHWHLGGRTLDVRAGTGSTACWLPDQVKIIGRVAALLRRGFDVKFAFTLATDPDALAGALAELTYIQADFWEDEDRGETA